MKNFLVKTKGSFRLNSREPQYKKYVVLVVVAFLALFFLKDLIGMTSSYVTSSLYTVRQYFQTSSATVPVYLRSRDELNERIQSLEQEVASQNGMSSALEYAQKENESLRLMLSASSSPRVLAGVIARPPYIPYDTFMLDKGSEDGIIENAPVFHGKGIAIGYVRSVFAHTSLVSLFSSPKVESTVYIFGANIFTTAYGEGGGIVRVSVPQGIVLTVGDVVVLPSLDTGVLGVISEIESNPTEPEQNAYVSLDAPLQSIRLVTVGQTPVEQTTFDMALFNVKENQQKLFTVPVPEDRRLHGNATTSSSTSLESSTTTNTQ